MHSCKTGGVEGERKKPGFKARPVKARWGEAAAGTALTSGWTSL